MARRSDRPMGAKTAGREASGLIAVYEGPQVLAELLARAGSPLPLEEVAKRFVIAQANGEERREVIPGLFSEEPRFESPADARRLYSNLFGLWERIDAGLGVTDDAPEPVPDETRVELPERGVVEGDRLTTDIVDVIWRYLAGIPDREQRRWRDRFAHAQPNLALWLDETTLPEPGAVATNDLAFETWAMFDQAFGDRLGTVSWSELKGLEAEPPALESEQPALARYAAEMLDNLADESPGFGLEARAQVERAAATVAAALTRSVAEQA